VKQGIMMIMLVVATAPALADEITLRGGARISGEIVSMNDDEVSIDIGGGIITARRESIESLERGPSALTTYRERAAGIPEGDAEAWRELATWARTHSLGSQSREAYRKVLAILPDDAEANRALGRVEFNGRWMPEDEAYAAQGFIEFEGEWMTPAEMESILADRRARDAQEAQLQNEIDAEVKAIEAEQRAAREAEDEHRRRVRNPISWGWGAGPQNWSTYNSEPRELAGGGYQP
jgi:hypothetical protein